MSPLLADQLPPLQADLRAVLRHHPRQLPPPVDLWADSRHQCRQCLGVAPTRMPRQTVGLRLRGRQWL